MWKTGRIMVGSICDDGVDNTVFSSSNLLGASILTINYSELLRALENRDENVAEIMNKLEDGFSAVSC